MCVCAGVWAGVDYCKHSRAEMMRKIGKCLVMQESHCGETRKIAAIYELRGVSTCASASALVSALASASSIDSVLF